MAGPKRTHQRRLNYTNTSGQRIQAQTNVTLSMQKNANKFMSFRVNQVTMPTSAKIISPYDGWETTVDQSTTFQELAVRVGSTVPRMVSITDTHNVETSFSIPPATADEVYPPPSDLKGEDKVIYTIWHSRPSTLPPFQKDGNEITVIFRRLP